MGSHQFLSGLHSTVPPINDPTDIAGCLLWLAADLQSFSNNDPVDTWVDNSGTANDATQGTAGFRPVFKTNIINSLPVVRFDGSDDRLEFSADPGATTTTFVVGTLNVAPASQTDYAPFVISAASAGLRVCAKVGASTNWGTYTGSDLVSGENLVNGTFSILEMTTTSGATYLYRNGTFKASNSSNSVGVGAGGINYVGAEVVVPRFINADIAEIIIYDSVLSSGDRILVENYLFSKYALP